MSDVRGSDERSSTLSGAVVRYRDTGEGAAIVFVHGVYVGGEVWSEVVARLGGFRSIVPTFPLGAHRDAAPDADLSARATAKRVVELLDALDLEDVTLVGNDTGGGLCLAALGCGLPGVERIGRLVLTNCDSYEHFPPPSFKPIVRICGSVPRLGAGVLRMMSSGPGRRMFLKSVCAKPPTGEAALRLFGAFADSAASRRDAVRFTSSLESSVTIDAVPALQGFAKPVLLAWGDMDTKFFPVAHAERLARDFPNARIDIIEGAAAYVMVDRPAGLAQAIRRFVMPA